MGSRFQFDMARGLPFGDGTFDLIFHPLSNCYVEEVKPIFKECFRVLRKGGILLCGLDNGINFIFEQFSHTLEEQIGGQLEAGFVLINLYEDTNGKGRLHEYKVIIQ